MPEVGSGSKEAPLDNHVLHALSKVLPLFCGKQNIAYLQCKQENLKTPFQCYNLGVELRGCVSSTAKDIEAQCGEAFSEHVDCLIEKGRNFSACGASEGKLLDCVKTNFPNLSE